MPPTHLKAQVEIQYANWYELTLRKVCSRRLVSAGFRGLWDDASSEYLTF